MFIDVQCGAWTGKIKTRRTVSAAASAPRLGAQQQLLLTYLCSCMLKNSNSRAIAAAVLLVVGAMAWYLKVALVGVQQGAIRLKERLRESAVQYT